MSAWAVAHLLQTQIGIETVLHFPTRGRNMLRVQGDLLASHALGLRNLFVVMGDPTRIGDFPDASDVNDVAPSRLNDVIKQGMNKGGRHGRAQHRQAQQLHRRLRAEYGRRRYRRAKCARCGTS